MRRHVNVTIIAENAETRRRNKSEGWISDCTSSKIAILQEKYGQALSNPRFTHNSLEGQHFYAFHNSGDSSTWQEVSHVVFCSWVNSHTFVLIFNIISSSTWIKFIIKIVMRNKHWWQQSVRRPEQSHSTIVWLKAPQHAEMVKTMNATERKRQQLPFVLQSQNWE